METKNNYAVQMNKDMIHYVPGYTWHLQWKRMTLFNDGLKLR